MAFCWGLIVALFALNVGFSSGANESSTAAPDTPSAAAGNGSIQTTAGHVTTSSPWPTGGFYTYLSARFKTNTCPSAKYPSLFSKFKSFYANPKFDFKPIVSRVRKETCQFSFNFTFGPNLKKYKISKVFEDKLKNINYTVDGMKLTDIETEVYVDGVTLGQFMAKADDCEKMCCDGGPGGPIKLTRTCTPSNKCRSYKLEKIVPNCTKACSKECSSGVTMCKISLLVLLFGVFMNWFLK